MKNGVYKITVMNVEYFEVYHNGTYVDMRVTQFDADRLFNNVEFSNVGMKRLIELERVSRLASNALVSRFNRK